MASLSKSLYTFRKYSADMLPHSSLLRTVARSYLSAIILVVSCLSFSAFSAEGIIATGDFETGDLGQWRTILAKDKSHQIQIVTSPVRQGKYAAKFVVENGDKYRRITGERAEVSTLLKLNDKDGPGDEFYYAWSTLFPKGFPPVVSWKPSFMNWHSAQGGIRAPLSFKIDPASQNILAQLSGGKCSNRSDCLDRIKTYTIVKNIAEGVWNDFVVHAKWTCSNNGLVEVWHKYANEKSYKKVLSVHSIPTLGAVPGWNGGNCMKVYKKQGLYRSSGEKGKHVIYQDGFTQGTSFEAVTKHAHNTTVTQNKKLSPPSNLQLNSPSY